MFCLKIGNKPASERPVGEYPYRVEKDDGNIALCVQAYTFTKYLGHLDLTFDDAGNVGAYSGNPILLDNSVAKGCIMLPHISPVNVLQHLIHLMKRMGLAKYDQFCLNI